MSLFQQIKKDLKKYSKIFEQKDRLSQSKASKVSLLPGLREGPASGLGGWQRLQRACAMLPPCAHLRVAGHPDAGGVAPSEGKEEESTSLYSRLESLSK